MQPLGFLVATTVTLSVTLFGCGSSSTTTTASPSLKWADDVCGALGTYRTALQGAVDDVKANGLSQGAVEQAGATMSAATDDFVTTVQGLGQPDTAAGDK